MSGGPKQPGEGELSVPSLPRQRGRRSIQFSDPTLSFPCTAPLSRASSPFPGEGFLPPGQVRLFSSLREEMRQRTCCPHAKGRQTGPC